jgi:RNA polymerase sigma factor (TIGR02999 family)
MPMSQVSRILRIIEKGDARAASELLPLLNDDLHWVARRRGLHTRERAPESARVENLPNGSPAGEFARQWFGGGHFYAAAAEALRRILVDHARQEAALERESDASAATAPIPSPAPIDIVMLDEALSLLGRKDPLAAQLIQLRYFASLSSAQAAEALGITAQDAEDTWRAARAWLLDRIQVQGGAQCKKA